MAVYAVSKWSSNDRETIVRKLNTMDLTKETYSKVCMFKGGPTMDGEPMSQVSSSPPTLTYTDILIATNNFSQENVIGCGGFGTVYKATLKDGTMVAVKKLVESGSQQGEREFMAEMETLGTVEHENLVPLLACCQCGGEKMLVYKLIRNGSLEDWLEKERDEGDWGLPSNRRMLTEEDISAYVNIEKLSWEVKVKIAKGCAKALAYLHHDCMMIHRDVKPSNILLDENFTPYMTDFGLARELAPGNSHISTMIAGTLGYVAPEYCHTWRATTRGDVYSFGVVMLELLTGQQPVSLLPSQPHDGSLVDWMRLLDAQSRAAEAWHPVVRQAAAANPEQVAKFMRLALVCTRDRPEQRPSMQQVSTALESM